MSKNPFSPSKLPPKISYGNLVSEIARANKSLGRLDALLFQLRNPRLLSRTMVTREAVLSSQIEGTQVTLNEVLEKEAQNVKKEETSEDRDFREVINYRLALQHGIKELESRPLTENLIKELHAILLQSARGKNRAPGEFRRKLVYIGNPGAPIEEASYVPPLPGAIPELFSDFERFIHSDEKEILVQIGIAHYQFEAIHPFEDGNGRIGRLLISLLLYQKKLLSYPFIYLSEFFEEHRREYYDLLLGVSEKEDWESWLKFFLRGIDVQAQKAQETSKKILDLHSSLNLRVVEFNSKYAHQFLDELFSNPYFSSHSMRNHTGIKNVQTVFTLISKFLNAGIVTDMTPNKKRNKFYRFDALLELLDAS